MALLAINKTRSEQGSVNKALSEQGPHIYDTVKHMTSVSRFEICQHVWNICITWGTFMYQQSIDVEDFFFDSTLRKLLYLLTLLASFCVYILELWNVLPAT